MVKDDIDHDRRSPVPGNLLFEAHDQHDPTKTFFFMAYNDEAGVTLCFVEGDARIDGMATLRDRMWIDAEQAEVLGKALIEFAARQRDGAA